MCRIRVCIYNIYCMNTFFFYSTEIVRCNFFFPCIVLAERIIAGTVPNKNWNGDKIGKTYNTTKEFTLKNVYNGFVNNCRVRI